MPRVNCDWKRLPLWLKTGLYFVAFDLLLYAVVIVLLTSDAYADCDPPWAFIITIPACPLIVFELPSIPDHLVSASIVWGILNFIWFLIQGVVVYFVLGAVVGAKLSRKAREKS